MKSIVNGLELLVKIVLYPIAALFCLVIAYEIWVEWVWPILAFLGALLGLIGIVALALIGSVLLVVAVASVVT